MYTIDAAIFKRFMETLNNIQDCDDVLVKNKKVQIETNSDHIIDVDLSSIDIPEDTAFTFIQFSQTFNTLKILTDFAEDIEYADDDVSSTFLSRTGKFVFDKGLIQNNWIDNPSENLTEENYLFNISVSNELFTKVSKLISLYKAFPTLETSENGIHISVKPRSSDRTIDLKISDENLFRNTDAQNPDQMSMTLTPILFMYKPDSEIDIKFYKDPDGYTLVSDFEVAAIPFRYIFTTDEYKEFDFSQITNLDSLLEV